MPDKAQVRAQLEASIAYVRSRIYTLEDYTARTLLGLYQKAFDVLLARLQAPCPGQESVHPSHIAV